MNRKRVYFQKRLSVLTALQDDMRTVRKVYPAARAYDDGDEYAVHANNGTGNVLAVSTTAESAWRKAAVYVKDHAL